MSRYKPRADRKPGGEHCSPYRFFANGKHPADLDQARSAGNEQVCRGRDDKMRLARPHWVLARRTAIMAAKPGFGTSQANQVTPTAVSELARNIVMYAKLVRFDCRW